jgi:ribonuclease-3
MWFRGDRDALEERLGHRFRDPDRLRAALVHRSSAHEAGHPDHNERLEFLGDAVLGWVAADWLFRILPEQPEGELARRKAWLVSAPALARHASELGLGERLELGVGELRSGGRAKASILADALEAVFGAVWLDGGLEAARAVIERYLVAADRQGEPSGADAKTALQELAQAHGWPLPAYELVGESGPDHDKRFRCRVTVGAAPAGGLAAEGDGRTKKEAQQRAAANALAAIESTPDPAPAGEGAGRVGPTIG